MASQDTPSEDVQLNHLFPYQIPDVMYGHWEPGKKYLALPGKEAEALVVDEIGCFIWEHCTGSISVRDLEELLVNKAKQDEDSVRKKLASFLLKLERKGFISFTQQ